MWASTKEAITTNVIKVAGSGQVLRKQWCAYVGKYTKEAVVCVAVTTNVVKVAGCGQVPRKQWCA